MKSTHHRLKQCRMMAGLTQGEVGRQLGVSGSTINKWETDVSDMGISQVPRLAEIYGVPPGQLFEPPPERTGITVAMARVFAKLAGVHIAAFLAVDCQEQRLAEAKQISRQYELSDKLPPAFREKWLDIAEAFLEEIGSSRNRDPGGAISW